MTVWRKYRNRNTGLVERYPETMAETFDYLEPVVDEAKALVNPPVSDAAIAGHIDHQAARLTEPAADDKGDLPEKGKK